jgi:hypothetical protein
MTTQFKRKTLDKWIEEAIKDEEKEGGISQLALVHMVGQQQEELHTTKFSSGKSWTARQLAEMFRDRALTYCQDLPGNHTFCLFAFYGGRSEPEAKHPFMIHSQADSAMISGTEPPTPEGRMMQSMRQSDNIFNQVYRRQQTLDDFSLRFMAVQNDFLEKTLQDNREMFTIMKDMMANAALNQHQHRMEEMKYERSTEERKKFITFLPALVNTILGKEVFPQSTEDTALIESIADSLTEEDVAKVASVVKPEMLGPLMARVEKALVKKRQAAEKDVELRRLTSGVGGRNPEADAAGDVIEGG